MRRWLGDGGGAGHAVVPGQPDPLQVGLTVSAVAPTDEALARASALSDEAWLCKPDAATRPVEDWLTPA